MIRLIILLSMCSQSLLATVAENYIDQYKYIAISEMQRTGIPASIKLAQGMLESNMGRSSLAINASNHFGIKCGRSWQGGTFYRKDDDKDKNGNLIPSCFRAFDSAEDSYVAHSEFLRGSKSGRYDFLFEIKKNDYKKWAYGLRKAGYATDKSYPRKLISIIEKYELYQYDDARNRSEEMVAKNEIDLIEKESRGGSRLKKEDHSIANVAIGGYGLNQINGVNYVVAVGGDNLKSIARALGLSAKDLLRHNEKIGSKGEALKEGSVVFLQRKKRSFNGSQKIHVIENGESMFEISQMYGIKLSNLYARNKMPKNSEPLPGERIYLKDTPPKGKRPKYIKEIDLIQEEEEFLFEVESEK